MRFHAEQHLRRPMEIRAVREQGQRLECRAFTVWWKPRPAAGGAETDSNPRPLSTQPRVCVIASTAAVGNAVRRNRAKRRLRELFRAQQGTLPANCDLLLIARRAVLDRPMPELTSTFADACRRLSTSKERP